MQLVPVLMSSIVYPIIILNIVVLTTYIVINARVPTENLRFPSSKQSHESLSQIQPFNILNELNPIHSSTVFFRFSVIFPYL